MSENKMSKKTISKEKQQEIVLEEIEKFFKKGGLVLIATPITNSKENNFKIKIRTVSNLNQNIVQKILLDELNRIEKQNFENQDIDPNSIMVH